MPTNFPRIERALQAVEELAGRLPPGNPQEAVRRSLGELRAAFAGRAAVEPVVDRLRQTLRDLCADGRAGRRRLFQIEFRSAGRVIEAVERELLPALRRVGFQV